MLMCAGWERESEAFYFRKGSKVELSLRYSLAPLIGYEKGDGWNDIRVKSRGEG